MGKDVVIAITGEGLGQDAYVQLKLDSGVVTHRVIGRYHYEGENLAYTLTYGDRSWTEPEALPQEQAEAQSQNAAAAADAWLYAVIGVVALAAIAGVALVILKKKKSASAGKN